MLMFIFILATFTCFIFIFPIKLKFQAEFINNSFTAYFRNKELKIPEIKLHNKNQAISQASSHNFKIICSMYNSLPHYMRPGICFSGEFNYGFEDAAVTGLCFGFASYIRTLVYEISKGYFNPSSFCLDIVPHYNRNVIEFKITCIFSLNLVKIIFILLKYNKIKGGINNG